MCVKRDVRVFLLAAFLRVNISSTVHHRNNPKTVSSPIFAVGIGLDACGTPLSSSLSLVPCEA